MEPYFLKGQGTVQSLCSAFSSCAYRTQGPAIYCSDFPSKPLCTWIIGREPSWQLPSPPAQPAPLNLREPAEEQGHRTHMQQCCACLCSQTCSGICSPRMTGPQNQRRQGHTAWRLKDIPGSHVRLNYLHFLMQNHHSFHNLRELSCWGRYFENFTYAQGL